MNDILVTLKPHDIVGPQKNVEDPLVILEEKEPIGGTAKRMKNYDEIQNDLSQWFRRR